MLLHHAVKALSNQKHTDFVARYGKDQIGLLTGDLSVNAAPRLW